MLFAVLSAIMLVVAGWSWLQLLSGHQDERQALYALLIATGVGLIGGGSSWAATRSVQTTIGRREAILLVAASWLIGAALAALPYRIWAAFDTGPGPAQTFDSAVNCYFEAMSGLTTTGATVLTGIELMPRSLLLWRSLTQWLGGLGIIVLFVAVLPSLGAGGKRLFRIEAPGPEPEGVRPHIRETARILWVIYVALTVVEVLALRIAGLSWFNAVCHTFTTMSSGGFSTLDASIGGFDSTAVRLIITFFMVLAGVNFALYYQAIRGRISQVGKDSELRCYLAILLAASFIVVWTIADQPITLTTGEEVPASTLNAIVEGVFTAVSLQTTTGFCTANFDHWPFLAKAVLVLLMFVGGSAGSTSGGIKVIRIVMAAKVLWSELERAFRPSVIRPVRVGTAKISEEMKLGALAYVVGVVLLFGVGTGTLLLLEPDQSINITTAATASIAALCNIGPGLDLVGAVQNYGWLSDASKLILSMLMVIGRLEVFAILVLIHPSFWRTT